MPPFEPRRNRHSDWRAALALVALSLAACLPGFFSLPPVDRDESRFAQASRQMFESIALPPERRDPSLHRGGWLVPMIADQPRLNKPPLIYWLQAAAAAALTRGDPHADAVWMYRVPSLLAAIAVVLATWRIGLSMFDPRAAVLAAVLIAVAPLFVWEAHQARADMVMVLFTVLALWSLWRIWILPKPRTDPPRVAWRWTVMLWVSLSLGILAKGPVTPMIVALTAISLSLAARDARWLMRTRPLLGLVILVTLIAPWLIALGERVGWSTLAGHARDEIVGRSTEPKEGHWGPPGYHLVVMVALFWPGSMLAGAAFVRACGSAFVRRPLADPPRRAISGWIVRIRRITPGRDAELFLIAWLAPAWIVFELVATKLPHYTMPLYPALALITARGVLGLTTQRLRHPLVRLGLVVTSIIGIAWLLAPHVALLAVSETPVPLSPAACILLLVVLGLGCVMLFRMVRAAMRSDTPRMSMFAVAAALCAEIALLGFSLPAAESVWITRRIARALPPVPDRPVASIDYHEDSLMFLTRGRLRRIDAHELDAWLAANPDGVLIAPPGLLASRPQVEVRATISGFNYSTGRNVRLAIGALREHAP